MNVLLFNKTYIPRADQHFKTKDQGRVEAKQGSFGVQM